MLLHLFKFGDLDPGSADFLLQEERIKQLRIGYEAQYRVNQMKCKKLQESFFVGRVIRYTC